MRQPFLSVIIPLFNKEKFIVDTLKSVLNQSYQDFEIIIIEDCSTDNSKTVIQEIHSEKIRMLEQAKNSGLSASRNTGILHSNADYLVFLDADDILKTDYLKKIHSLIQTFPEAALFATNYEEIYTLNNTISPTQNLQNTSDGILANYFESSLYQPLYIPSSLCVKKTVFDEIGCFDTKITYGEDVDFNIRSNSCYKLAYSPEILVQQIKFDKNQITNSSLKGKIIPDFDSYEPLVNTIKYLKKYLDINRYMMASNYKKQGDLIHYRKLRNSIDPNPAISGLNYKQRLLLNSPSFFLQFLSKLKLFLLRKGIVCTTFSN
jgi:glycosyltransferase involved in cell wall biosynthesis